MAALQKANKEKLIDAIKLGDASTAGTLLDGGLDVNRTKWDGLSALHIACKHGHANLVKLLLDKGANANLLTTGSKQEPMQYMEASLHIACKGGHMDIVRVLLDGGAIVDLKDQFGSTAFYRACIHAHLAIAQLLLDRGANVNRPAQDNPWFQTSIISNLKMATFLLDHGVNVDLVDKERQSALHRACRGPMPQIVRLLLDRGATIDGRDKMGKRPLHIACEYGFTEAVELLLERGADVELPNTEQWTPLHMACNARKADPRIVQLLLDHGADADTPAGELGWPALQFACTNGHVDIVRVLLDHGADFKDIRPDFFKQEKNSEIQALFAERRSRCEEYLLK